MKKTWETKKRFISILLLFCCLFMMVGCSTTLESTGTDKSSDNVSVQTKENTNILTKIPNSAIQTNLSQLLSEKSTFRIQFIDVGQADAALVECDGHYMLIDGGNKADSNVIYSILKKKDISHLDLVVGTHAHEDHIGGIPGAFQYADADITLCTTQTYDSNPPLSTLSNTEKNINFATYFVD